MKHTLTYDDAALQRAVLAELGVAGLPSAHIGVTAQRGVVTLLGYVDNAAQKRLAEQAALGLDQVKAVALVIEIRATDASGRHDDQIAAEVLSRLAWDAWVPRDALKVKVEQGWVTLIGEVDHEKEKTAALQDISRLFGVSGVTDLITVKGTQTAKTRAAKGP
jgi:osmotically-inducible protein OsmY